MAGVVGFMGSPPVRMRGCIPFPFEGVTGGAGASVAETAVLPFKNVTEGPVA